MDFEELRWALRSRNEIRAVTKIFVETVRNIQAASRWPFAVLLSDGNRQTMPIAGKLQVMITGNQED